MGSTLPNTLPKLVPSPSTTLHYTLHPSKHPTDSDTTMGSKLSCFKRGKSRKLRKSASGKMIYPKIVSGDQLSERDYSFPKWAHVPPDYIEMHMSVASRHQSSSTN